MQVAVVMLPGFTRLLSDEGKVKLRLKVSLSSTILSIVTGTLIVVLSVPIEKVAVIGVEV